MTDPTVKCPKCSTEFKLTESLAGPIIESVKKQYEERIASARAEIAQEEAKKARASLEGDLNSKQQELASLQETLKERDEKLAEAQKAQADLMRQQRELDDQKREMELTIERRILEGAESARALATKQAEETLERKLQEKDGAMKALEKRLTEDLQAKDRDVQAREIALRQQREELGRQKANLDGQVAETLAKERSRIAAEEQQKARQSLSADLDQKTRDLNELQETLARQNDKLAEAQKAQADLLRKQRELDDEKREMELTIEKRIQESLETTHAQARKQAEEELTLKLKEKEHVIGSLQKQIDDLKRRAEQGSQQLQGEVQELELEALLSGQFPTDGIEPVPKGQRGSDVLQRVLTPQGVQCGTILWEAKRTKNWTESWLPKLRDDQREAKADFAILVSRVLPKGIDTFELRDGVWLATPACAIPLAVMMRQSLFELMRAKRSGEGQQTKMEMLYEYLTGPRFRHRVQAVVEKFSEMQGDLEKERRTMTKAWAKREAQIRTVLDSTAGMYGDLQGIAGKTLQEIEGLEMKLLPADGDEVPESDQ